MDKDKNEEFIPSTSDDDGAESSVDHGAPIEDDE